MSAEKLIWGILFVVGGLFLFHRAALTEHGMGKVYVEEVRVKPDDPADLRTRIVGAVAKNHDKPNVRISVSRTVGLWLGAFFTLAVFSFLYRDNVFYKIAESIFVGVSAAYAMVVGFWDGIVKYLLVNLFPDLARNWVMPGLAAEHPPDGLFFIPLILGLMLLWRLSPVGGWIARWPLGFIVGTFAGLRLVNFLDADFVTQIRSSIIPLVVFTADGGFSLWLSLRNIGLIVGLISCLTYFFFSFEHHGLIGRVARIGIWFLMITFGASFAFTVMGRIALLSARIQFLFDDWLWLIDPNLRRPDGW